MATYYLDDSRPDDTGAGTSAATAKKTFRAAWALCTTAMDILRIKDNGNWYTLIPTSAGETLNTVTNLFILPYVGSSTKPKLLLKKDSANPTFFGTLTSGAKIYITGIQVRREWTGTTNAIPPFYFTNSAATGATAYLTDCIEEDYKTDNPTTGHQGSGVIATGSGSAMVRQSVKQLHTGGRFRWHNGSSGSLGKRINCWGSVAPSQAENIGTKIGDRFIILGPPSNQGIMGATGTNPLLSSNNNYVLDTTNASQWVVTTPTGSTNLTPAITAFNDLWVKTGANTAYAYSSSTAYTVSGNNMMGKCVFAGFTALTQNITGLVEQLGTSTTPSWTTSIFKSLDPDNANFLIIDETQTAVVAALSAQGLLPGTDIGYNIPAISGETDPAKVLNTSTVVSGLINPAKLMANDPSGSGTLPLNRVSPNAGQGGTQDLPLLSKVAPSDTLEGVAGTMNLPALNKVAPSATLEGVPGTMDIPSLNNLRDNDTLEGATGLLSSDDVAARAGGNIPQSDITTDYDGDYLKADVTKYKKDEPVGDGETGEYDPITGVWEAFSATDIISTAAPKKQNGVTVTGVQVIPSPSVVLEGEEVGTTTGTFSPDYADPANVLENDTSGGVAGEIPLSSVKETDGGTLPIDKIAPSENGTYLGQESNDPLLPADLRLGKSQLNLGNTIVGEHAGGSVVIPNNKVVYPYAYTDAEGSKIGQAGYIDISNANISGEIVEAVEALFANQFPSYSRMKYVLDPLKNDFNNNGKQYGILVQDSFDDANKLLNGDVVDYQFKLVLTNDYISQPGDDIDARAATQELIKTMEEMRRVIKYTRAGTYDQGNLLWEFNFRVDNPQVIDSSKLVILNGYFRAKAKNTYIV